MGRCSQSRIGRFSASIVAAAGTLAASPAWGQTWCPADCDLSGELDFFDTLCFLNVFNNNDLGADCDGSGTVDLFDINFFLNQYNEGCVENTYGASQRPVVVEGFGVTTFGGIAAFETNLSSIYSEVSGGDHVVLGATEWRTLHVYMYDWQAAGSSFEHADFFTTGDVEMALVIGELEGAIGTVPCIALAFDIDQGEDRRHYLVPLIKAPDIVYSAAREVGSPPEAWQEDPCFSLDDNFCFNTFRVRFKDALDNFLPCMSSAVPPVGLGAVACLVMCAPFVPALPVYLTCVAGCSFAAGTLSTGITLVSCSDVLAYEKENAKVSYCVCLQHKLVNCPGRAEVDLVGCP